MQCSKPRFDPWVGKFPWKREWLPTPGKSLENSTDRGAWRTTVEGIAELDTTEQLIFSLSLSKYSLVHSYFIKSLCMNYFIH